MNYGIKYKVPFKSIGGISYEIFIEPDGYTGAVMELTGGVPAMETEYDTDDVLVPIRASKGTVSVYGSDYLQSLYTSNPQGIRVRLMKEGALEWLGFVTPDTFSQDFSRKEFIYDIECTCALSTLKYKEFKETGDTITFLQLIKNAATLAGYSKLYLTKSVCGKNNENIYETSSVAVGNFYDELGKPMNYYEILEELAKYLVCSTFLPYKDALYLLDYSAVRSNNSGFYEYIAPVSPATEWTLNTVYLFQFPTTQDLGYKGTGATLSRIAGKNKATVNCSLYEVDNLLPEFNDEQSEFVIMQEVMSKSGSGKTYKRRDGIMRFYNNPKYIFYRYNGILVEETSNALASGQAGTCFVRLASWDYGNIPNKLNFEDMVLIYNVIDNIASYQSVPAVSIKSSKTFVFGKDTRFGISLTARFMPSMLHLLVPASIFKDGTGVMKLDNKKYVEIPFTLTIGDYYYTYNGWMKKEGGAMVNHICSMSIALNKGDYLDGVDYTVVNGNDYRLGVNNLNGFITQPLPKIIYGKLELKLYVPYGAQGWNVFNSAYCAYYKNIKIGCEVQNKAGIYGDWVNKDSKNDVVYENKISEEYVEEADSIDLKICTNQDGKTCLSSVIAANDDFQKEIKHLPLDAVDIAENLILKKVIQTYNRPRYAINPIVKNELKPYALVKDLGLPYKMMVVAGGKENYNMDSFEANLIEL